MAYTNFSTKNADYVLQLGNHPWKNKHDNSMFKGIDALVIEHSNLQTFQNLLSGNHPQMAPPINYCFERQIPIFGCDSDITFSGNVRDNVGYIVPLVGLFRGYTIPALILLKSPTLFNGITTKELDNSIRLVNYLDIAFSYINQLPTVTGRDAINSKKIDEYLAPKLTEESGRKPKIGMVFGAGHLGLKYNLQHKLIRDITLFNWGKLNIGKFSGFEKSGLNRVLEAIPEEDEWKIREHKLDLFN